MQDFSVGAVLSAIWDFLVRLLEPLHRVVAFVPWDFGDWTVFLALALPLLGGVLRRSLGWRGEGHGGKLFLAGILLGGVVEHYQPWIEGCVLGTGCG